MRMLKVFVGAFFVGGLSVLYNYLVFTVFDFYPDLPFEFDFFGGIYFAIFIKNFLVGLLLMYLFSVAYSSINKPNKEGKGIIFFVLYAITAFAAFSFGDILLMGTQEGLLLILTVDGFIETIIATFPVKIFYVES